MSQIDYLNGLGVAGATTAGTAGGLGMALNGAWAPAGTMGTAAAGLGLAAAPIAIGTGAGLLGAVSTDNYARKQADGYDSLLPDYVIAQRDALRKWRANQASQQAGSGNSMNPEITAMEQAGATPEQIAKALTPANVEEETSTVSATAPAAYYPTYNANRESGLTSVAKAYKNNPAMLKMPKQTKKAGITNANTKTTVKVPAKQNVKVNSLDWLNDLLPLLAAGGLGYLVARH